MKGYSKAILTYIYFALTADVELDFDGGGPSTGQILPDTFSKTEMWDWIRDQVTVITGVPTAQLPMSHKQAAMLLLKLQYPHRNYKELQILYTRFLGPKSGSIEPVGRHRDELDEDKGNASWFPNMVDELEGLVLDTKDL